MTDIKKKSVIIITREMQIKITIEYHLTSVKRANIKTKVRVIKVVE